MMPFRFSPDALNTADAALAEAQVAIDILAEGFPTLLETHELTAAIMQVADSLDSQFEIRQTQLIAALLIAQRARPDRTGRRVSDFADFDDAAVRAAEGHSPELARPYLPTPRTKEQINGIWGRNAVEVDPVQGAHEALWSSMTGQERTDAQQVLDQLAAKGDELASEGEADRG